MNMTQLYYCEHICARNTKKIVLKSHKDKKYKKGTYELCTQKIQKRKLKTCHYRNE